jgi:quercetin dioxygenase-like cupin family protein
MRRIIAFLTLALALLLSVVAAANMVPGARAQDATPGPPESFEIAPGVSVDNVVFAEGQDEPASYRLHFEAGVTYPVEPSPALELVYVEAGTLTMQLDAPVTIGHLAATNVGGETIDAGMEVSVTAGEYFVIAPGTGGEVRNDGEDTAIVSVAGILPTGEATPADATPTG